MHVDDVKQSITALDNSQYAISLSFCVLKNSYISICQWFRDIRNSYSMILDKIEKNYAKITNPKGIAANLQQDLLY